MPKVDAADAIFLWIFRKNKTNIREDNAALAVVFAYVYRFMTDDSLALSVVAPCDKIQQIYLCFFCFFVKIM